MTSPFNSKHPRGPGGLFRQTQAAAQGHPTGAWAAGPMRYDPTGRKGTGYGIRGGDPRVRALQAALNRLGVTDSRGRPLAVDGQLGPLTTQAVMAAQRKLGLRPDGVVSAQLMVSILTMKPTAAARPGRTARRLMSRRPTRRPTPSPMPKPTAALGPPRNFRPI